MSVQRAPSAAEQPQLPPPAGEITHRAVATPWVRQRAAESGISLDGPGERGRRITAADLERLSTPAPAAPSVHATAQADLTLLTRQAAGDPVLRTALVAEAWVRLWRHTGLAEDTTALHVVRGGETSTVAAPGTLSAAGMHARLRQPSSDDDVASGSADLLTLVDLSESRVTSLQGAPGEVGRGVLVLGAALPTVTAHRDAEAEGHTLAVRTVATLTYHGPPDTELNSLVSTLGSLVDSLEGVRP